MKIYVIINDKKRVEFEKAYQIPYGYHGLPIFDKFKDALSCFNNNYYDSKVVGSYIYDDPKDMVIECCESGTRQIVYTM